jgi:hypothetical protein
MVQGGAVLAAADRQRPQVGDRGDGQGGDDGGQGVAADELQDQEAGPGGADPADAPNPAARFSARRAKSSADCPETRPPGFGAYEEDGG